MELSCVSAYLPMFFNMASIDITYHSYVIWCFNVVLIASSLFDQFIFNSFIFLPLGFAYNNLLSSNRHLLCIICFEIIHKLYKFRFMLYSLDGAILYNNFIQNHYVCYFKMSERMNWLYCACRMLLQTFSKLEKNIKKLSISKRTNYLDCFNYNCASCDIHLLFSFYTL